MIAPVHLLSIAVLTGVLSLCVLGSLARSGMAGIRETIRANLLTLLAFFCSGCRPPRRRAGLRSSCLTC